jgi:organic hydroperoxide reductase OsmC/OhrA
LVAALSDRSARLQHEERMKIAAIVRNDRARHEVVVSTGDARQSLAVPAKPSGPGSAVNGGEFLMLALATCYCNDLYREAARLGVPLDAVEVEASAEFPGVGLAATNIAYRATVKSAAPSAEIAELLRVTDAVAEIHNTVRSGATVTLQSA